MAVHGRSEGFARAGGAVARCLVRGFVGLCMSCGAPIPVGAEVCGRCGKAFGRAEPSPPAAAAEDEPSEARADERGLDPAASRAATDTGRIQRATVPIHAAELPTHARRRPAITQGTQILAGAAGSQAAQRDPQGSTSSRPPKGTAILTDVGPIPPLATPASPSDASAERDARAPERALSSEAVEPPPPSGTTVMPAPLPREGEVRAAESDAGATIVATVEDDWDPGTRPLYEVPPEPSASPGSGPAEERDPDSLTRPGVVPFPHLAPKERAPARTTNLAALPTGASDATSALPSAASVAPPAAAPHAAPPAAPHAAPPAAPSAAPPAAPSAAPPAAPSAERPSTRPIPQHFSLPPSVIPPADDEPPPTQAFPQPAPLPRIDTLVDPANAPPMSPPIALPGAPRAPQPSLAAREEAAMSMVAGTAKIISEAFNVGFGKSIPGWRTEVAAPVGLSTEGGKHALLPVTLVNDAGQRITIGHTDALARRVVLRTHAALIRAYSARYGQGWSVSREQHEELCEGIRAFFAAMQFDVAMDERVSGPPPRAVTRSSTPAVLGVAFLGLVLVVLVLWLAR